jgi:alanine racemase
MESLLVWAEVDLKAIAHNIRSLRKLSDPSARLMAIVKANGYGHGANEAAKTALDSGAALLGVARAHEGVSLREAGFDVPILVLSHSPPSIAKTLIDYDLTQTISSLLGAEALNSAAAKLDKKITIHLKVDSGMGRLGIQPDCRRCNTDGLDAESSAVDEVASIVRLSHLEFEGIFTHFATADDADKTYANQQFEIFMEFIEDLKKAGIDPLVKHAANSASIIDLPGTHLDMVRAGIATYGLWPSPEVDKSRIDLKPAMALKTRVAHLKKVPAGQKFSYGIIYETATPTTIATLPVGYADCLNRLMSSNGYMLVCGKKAPIVGRICMDQTMLDVGQIPEVELDSEVVIFGQQGDESITVDDFAARIQTINYEVVCSITNRVPRIYLD